MEPVSTLYFTDLAGVDDVSDLEAAGINTVRNYAQASCRTITSLTKQKALEVKARQRAAQIYLCSGLAPELSLRMVQAGARNACETLLLDADAVTESDSERNAFDLARIIIAYENVRHFLSMKGVESKDTVLDELTKLKPTQRQVALRSVEILCSLPQFRWLNIEANQLIGKELDPKQLKTILSALSEEDVGSIVGQLREQYEAELLTPPSAPSPAKLAAPSALAAATAAAAPGTSQIEGIGPRYAGLLTRAGISSIEDLRTMDIERIHTQMGIGRKQLWNWKAAGILLQLPGVDGQIAEALVAAGFTDIAKVALAQPMDLYYALQQARTPREARNIIPDTYRVLTPNHARQLQRSAYEMYSGKEPIQRALVPHASFIAAHPSNYGPDPRCRTYDYIVIHAMLGSFDGTKQEFITPPSEKKEPKSAHYLVGQDGKLLQMVCVSDVAFHAKNSGGGCRGLPASGCSGRRDSGERWTAGPCNCQSIGIELEDKGKYPGNERWVTDAMYQKTAELVRGLCDSCNIPKVFVGERNWTRGILGHQHVPNRTQGKEDPGRHFDWGKFMNMVNPSAPEPEPDDDKGGGK
jgi:N-acetyl-anhydromuramyl-L-alanine amidase AmpD/predicted flap endonuclease-1-like 5' DNA nuclease